MSDLNSLINSEEVQSIYKKETGKNAKWGGSLTNVFKDWVGENKDKLNLPDEKLIDERKDVKPVIIKPKAKKTVEISKKKSEKEEDKFPPDEILLKKDVDIEHKSKEIVIEKKPEEDKSKGIIIKKKPIEKEEIKKTTIIKPKEISIKPKEKVVSKEGKKLVSSGISKHTSPTVFTASFNDTWIPLIQEGSERKKKRIKRKKGIIMILSGDTGAGKTHLAVDMVNVPEVELTYRIIPSGKPVYLVTTDNSPLDEVERNYKEHLWVDVFPFNCYVEDPKTGLVDPIETLKKMNQHISALKDRTEGILIIEDWTMYCAFVLYSYMMKEGGAKGAGITFGDFLRPERPLSPTEYQYKARLVDEILLSFQNKFNINIILIANLKDDWISTGSTVYDIEKAGLKEDMQKGSERRADVMVRMWKEEIEGKIYRKLIFKKSRFEGNVVIANEQILTQPTAKELIKTILKLYLTSDI